MYKKFKQFATILNTLLRRFLFSQKFTQSGNYGILMLVPTRGDSHLGVQEYYHGENFYVVRSYICVLFGHNIKNKMSRLNVSCGVCKKRFQEADSIRSTSCGHVFHNSCLEQWFLRMQKCPQCVANYPTLQRIFLNFEGDVEYDNIVKDLNAKLETSKDELTKMKKENTKKDVKIDDIQRLYNISEQWRAELQDKIQILSVEKQTQADEFSKELDAKFKEIESLKMHIEILEKEKGVQSLYEKINEFSAENSKLGKSLKESETAKLILNQKLETLEHRLEYVNSELKKQYEESLSESIKNNLTTLQKQTHNGGAQNKIGGENRRRRTRNNDSTNLSCEQGAQNKIGGDSRRRIRKKDSTNLSCEQGAASVIAATNMQTKQTKIFKMSQPNDSRIIITNFDRNNLVYPLNFTVIILAQKMSIPLLNEDISSVNIIDSKKNSTLNGKVALSVQFKDIDKKIQFLTYRNRLKSSNSINFIQIKEYIDESIYNIFMYANRKLRSNGYEYIGCRNNKVIAKKKLNEPDEIVIRDQNHVDSLLGIQDTPAAFDTKLFSLNSSMSSIFKWPF